MLSGVEITIYTGDTPLDTAVTDENGVALFEVPENKCENLSVIINPDGVDDVVIPGYNFYFEDDSKELTIKLKITVDLPVVPF